MEQPKIFHVQSNIHENSEIFTLELVPQEKNPFSFLPGQFNMMYLFGIGEVPISISSNPAQKELLLHTIRAVGPVTIGMKKLQKGDSVGIRGPFGNSWPLSQKGGDVLIIAGGVGLAPLRAAVYDFASRRKDFQHLTLLYGARSSEDIIYKEDLEVWKRMGVDVQITLDKGDPTWTGPVGVITTLIKKNVYDPKNTLCLICGPEIMFHFCLKELLPLNVSEEKIYFSMERNMQCGTGFCGHCQFGPYFICKDGPIFPYTTLKQWLAIKEL